MKLFRLVAIGSLLTGSVWAQNNSFFHRVDLYGGYSFINQDTNGTAGRQNMNGWETSATVNANHWLGVEGAVGGYYQHIGNALGADIGANDDIFAAGPRFTVRPFFFMPSSVWIDLPTMSTQTDPCLWAHRAHRRIASPRCSAVAWNGGYGAASRFGQLSITC